MNAVKKRRNINNRRSRSLARSQSVSNENENENEEQNGNKGQYCYLMAFYFRCVANRTFILFLFERTQKTSKWESRRNGRSRAVVYVDGMVQICFFVFVLNGMDRLDDSHFGCMHMIGIRCRLWPKNATFPGFLFAEKKVRHHHSSRSPPSGYRFGLQLFHRAINPLACRTSFDLTKSGCVCVASSNHS